MTEDSKATLFKLFDFMNYNDNWNYWVIEKYGKRTAVAKWTHDLAGTIVTVVFLDGEHNFLMRTPQWSIEMIEDNDGKCITSFKGSKKAFLRDMIYAKCFLG